MRKYTLAVFIFVFVIVCRMDVYAAAGDEVYDNRGNVIGIYDENGRIIYQPYAGDADENSNGASRYLKSENENGEMPILSPQFNRCFRGHKRSCPS